MSAGHTDDRNLCGHHSTTTGCGGCDPGATEYIMQDGPPGAPPLLRHAREHETTIRPAPSERGHPMTTQPTCEMCGTARTTNTPDYNPLDALDVFQHGKWGWTSHPDDGELCGPCMKSVFDWANRHTTTQRQQDTDSSSSTL